jgi:hypothetical protein
MSSFEDRLWSELVREHGQTLAGTDARPSSPPWRSPSRPRRSQRPRDLPGPRWSSRGLLAAVAAALAAVLTVGVLALTAKTTAPAYAVVVNRDGSVTLTIDELIGVSAANARLAALGVPARAAVIEAGCAVKGVRVRFPPRASRNGLPEPWIAGMIRPEKSHPGFGGLGMVIRPAGIPRGDTLLLTARWLDSTHAGTPVRAVGLSFGLYRGPAPSCVPLR